MISVFDNKKECCGCEACRQVCPSHCISMKEDVKGFFYPEIDQSKCIDCGLCRRTCMYHNDILKEGEDKCWMYLNNNEDYRLHSSSSGAFEAICRAFCDNVDENSILIFGCELNDELIAQHCSSNGFVKFSKFRKSKYIQSRIGDSYIYARAALQAGKTVIFSGTPCQIMGLKLFLKKEYDNLLLVDILCHGVPSQKAFNKYIYVLENKYKSKVISYQFRHKTKGDNAIWRNEDIQMFLKNGRSIILDGSKDMYMMSFMKGLMNRLSCEECLFASEKRVSDVTMGDFWGIEYSKPEYSEQLTNGTSLLLLNTEKGKRLQDKLKRNAVMIDFPLNVATPYNGQLTHPQKLDKDSELFYSNINKRNGFLRAMRVCYPQLYGRKACFHKWLFSQPAYKFLSKIKNQILK